MRSFVGRWLRRLGWVLALAIVVAAGLAGWQRERLLAWYAVRGLLQAGEGEREAWVDRVADHERRALPLLLSGLRREQPLACANVRAGLQRLSQGWHPDDPRHGRLAQLLARDFHVYSVEGQKATLDLVQSRSQSV